MLMFPEPKESAPVAESGFGVAGELVLGEAGSGLSFGFGGLGSGVLAAASLSSVFVFGVEACTGARPGRYVTMRLVPCSLPGRRMGAIQAR